MSSPPKISTPPAATSPTASAPSTGYAPPVGSPPPPAEVPAHVVPAPATTPHANPKVAELQAMFPTVEVSVIELVLETCGGSTDRSIEQLLSMTDDNFKPDELTSVRREEAEQVDLDEEFARSLVMQDEQSQQDRGGYRASTGQQQPQGIPPPDQLPYQARVRKTRPMNPIQTQEQRYGGQWDSSGSRHDPSRAESDNPNGMLAVEDKINRFAETAGATFNTFLGRAKAKYSEFQQQQQQRQAENAGINARESSWGQEPQTYQNQNQWSAPGGGRGGQGGRAGAGSGTGWGDSTFEDHSRSESISSESTTGTPTLAQPVVRPSPGRWQPSDTYDDPIPAQRSLSGQQIGGRKSPGVGSPDKPTTGKIDPAKLGILPKKRVDLLSTSPSSGPGPVVPPKSTLPEEDFNAGIPNANASTSSDLVNKIPPTPPATKDPKSPYRLEDSDDELEYTKSPFEGR